MVTCFPFMVTVYCRLLRQGIGLQAAPPNLLMISLALFLTYFVMEPVFDEAWTAGISPLLDGDIDPEQGFQRGIAPFETFMRATGPARDDHLHWPKRHRGAALRSVKMAEANLGLLDPGLHAQ